MSYAKLAGLPNVYGLYGAFVPVMIYAILGSSPQLVSFCSSAFEFSETWPVQQIWFLTIVTPVQSALVMWFVQMSQRRLCMTAGASVPSQRSITSFRSIWLAFVCT